MSIRFVAADPDMFEVHDGASKLTITWCANHFQIDIEYFNDDIRIVIDADDVPALLLWMQSKLSVFYAGTRSIADLAAIDAEVNRIRGSYRNDD